VNFVQAINSGFSKYVQFGDRAARSEYWYWTLFSTLASIAASILDGVLGMGIISGLVGLALLLPASL
jgi:uncharacterized membrane protein YhaH (DUF805 family)